MILEKAEKPKKVYVNYNYYTVNNFTVKIQVYVRVYDLDFEIKFKEV